MSGNTSLRGYLLQTIITLLDALDDDSNWIGLTLEPNIMSEKIDIVWYYPESLIKVTQVKSSQNQINLRQVKTWASELEKSIVATDYELVLIGPCSEKVPKIKKVGNVVVPIPKVLNADSLIEQAAHRLDLYSERKGIPKIPALTREMLISALVTKLETFSTSSTAISREELNEIIHDWIVSILNRSTSNGIQPSINRNGLNLNQWVDILVSYQLSKAHIPHLAEIFDWINQLQPAMKVIDEGINRFTQGGFISNKQIWQYYLDAKKLEETLENISVPPIVLQAHFEIRESARHYRRAVGSLHSKDQGAFSQELTISKQHTLTAAKLLNEIVGGIKI
jgi:hypothetical protein